MYEPIGDFGPGQHEHHIDLMAAKSVVDNSIPVGVAIGSGLTTGQNIKNYADQVAGNVNRVLAGLDGLINFISTMVTIGVENASTIATNTPLQNAITALSTLAIVYLTSRSVSDKFAELSDHLQDYQKVVPVVAQVLEIEENLAMGRQTSPSTSRF